MYNDIALYNILLEQARKLNKDRIQHERDYIPDYCPDRQMPRTQLSEKIKREVR